MAAPLGLMEQIVCKAGWVRLHRNAIFKKQSSYGLGGHRSHKRFRLFDCPAQVCSQRHPINGRLGADAYIILGCKPRKCVSPSFPQF